MRRDQLSAGFIP